MSADDGGARRRGAPVAGRRGRLVVVSGPSGVGKDTVLVELFRHTPAHLRRSVSVTTRSPRPGERDGVDYRFVDEPSFRAMVDRGELLEWATVHENLYGTSRRLVEATIAGGDDIVLKIDVQGAATLRARIPDALFVFLLPPSLEVLRQRLAERGTDDAASLARRQADASTELAEAEHYDWRVMNDDVERAAAEILAILRDAPRQQTVGG